MDKAKLAGRVMDMGKEDGGPVFAERLAKLFKEAGVVFPQVTLEYRDLCIEADALVGSGSTPSLGNTLENMMKKLTCQARRGWPGGCMHGMARQPCRHGMACAACGWCDACPAAASRCLAWPAWMQGGLKTAKVQILKNVTGALRPGTTTLLLGPPGSGKSVFMQALSGRLQSDAKVKVCAAGRLFAGLRADNCQATVVYPAAGT